VQAQQQTVARCRRRATLPLLPCRGSSSWRAGLRGCGARQTGRRVVPRSGGATATETLPLGAQVPAGGSSSGVAGVTRVTQQQITQQQKMLLLSQRRVTASAALTLGSCWEQTLLLCCSCGIRRAAGVARALAVRQRLRRLRRLRRLVVRTLLLHGLVTGTTMMTMRITTMDDSGLSGMLVACFAAFAIWPGLLSWGWVTTATMDASGFLGAVLLGFSCGLVKGLLSSDVDYSCGGQRHVCAFFFLFLIFVGSSGFGDMVVCCCEVQPARVCHVFVYIYHTCNT
jgi:hypothetical protein